VLRVIHTINNFSVMVGRVIVVIQRQCIFQRAKDVYKGVVFLQMLCRGGESVYLMTSQVARTCDSQR